MKDPPEWVHQQGQAFTIPGYGYNVLAAELNEAGWTSEAFHGKLFILCPSCGEKSTVERSQFDLKTQPR